MAIKLLLNKYEVVNKKEHSNIKELASFLGIKKIQYVEKKIKEGFYKTTQIIKTDNNTYITFEVISDLNYFDSVKKCAEFFGTTQTSTIRKYIKKVRFKKYQIKKL